MKQVQSQSPISTRCILVSLLATSLFLDASAFTSSPFSPRPVDFAAVSSLAKKFPDPRFRGGNGSLRARSEVETAVDPLENSAGIIGNSDDETGQGGLKPPFSVTLEGEDSESYSRAIERTLAWVGAACVFGGGLFAFYGSETGEQFFAGYLLEQSLSIDNLFVFLLLFDYFKVPTQYQDRVLNWGIYGAVVMRATMISIGAAALAEYHQILLVFAAILLFSSVSFFLGGDDDDDAEVGENAIVKFSRSLINSTEKFDGDRFFTWEDGIKKATPMLICTFAVEISDVVFAVDSIPAVFGVTENPLVVFSSNMFAILGLRSMYTILSKAAQDLKYLEPAVAVVLGFIGSKMIAEYFGVEIPTSVALGVVASVLASGIGASVYEKEKKNKPA
eukprot:CAMPEP_0198144112 /NCGR_PEP_ID=MMETSP1443-20131203/13232_1 /TAXON_ID=186043 /ORGANISM="Entomoneis sp., Strain CCMP2396" /LENGTH=389 /DNA_ID=CAMNT_0043807457 /DNA_START=163 /DNA_END=1333 /DNA_ORIENTATION=-